MKKGSIEYSYTLAAVLILAVLCMLLITCGKGEQSGGGLDSGGIEPMEEIEASRRITIYNAANETVFYTIESTEAAEPAVDRNIALSDLDYIDCLGDIRITFRSDEKVVRRDLRCGADYSFYYDSDGILSLKEGRMMGIDAEDLAPYAGTPMPVIEKMLEMARISREDILYDLGSGDGRIVIAAARIYGCRGVGLEYNPGLIRESVLKAEQEGVSHLVEFRQEDITTADYSEATVVSLYLFSASNAALRPQLEAQLKPGTLVVCHNYPVPGWEAKEIDRQSIILEGGDRHQIILYRR